jgi:hypothetical protein
MTDLDPYVSPLRYDTRRRNRPVGFLALTHTSPTWLQTLRLLGQDARPHRPPPSDPRRSHPPHRLVDPRLHALRFRRGKDGRGGRGRLARQGGGHPAGQGPYRTRRGE